MDTDFRLFKLELPARLVLAGGLFLACFALGLVSPLTIIPALILAIVGWFPLRLKTLSNRPDDQGLEEWRPVTMAEVDALDDAIRTTKATKKKSGQGFSTFVGILVFIVASMTAFIAFTDSRIDIAFVSAASLLCLIPGLFFGRLRLHVPADIAFKLPSFKALLSTTAPKGVVVVPSIRYDKDSKGADVPEDLRITYENRRPLPDFVGIQVQCAKNKGPNGEVPYLYAVVITRGKEGKAHRAAKNLDLPGYEVEAGGDTSYGTVVIRQFTTGTGYYTKPDDCARLGRLCGELAASLADS